MTTRHARRTLLLNRAVIPLTTFVWLGIATGAQWAEAQEVATSFQQLRPTLQVGDTIRAVAGTGRTVTGRLSDLSEHSIELLVPDAGDSTRRRSAPVRLSEGEVRALWRQHDDPLWNGGARGAAAGAAIGAAAGGASFFVTDGLDTFVAALSQSAALGAVAGLAAGVLIDAAHHARTLVYRENSRRP